MRRLTPTEIHEHARDLAEEVGVFYPADVWPPAGLLEDDAEAVNGLAMKATFRAVLPGDVQPAAWLRGRAQHFSETATRFRAERMHEDAVTADTVAKELRRCADEIGRDR